jgi:hypothetical protein
MPKGNNDVKPRAGVRPSPPIMLTRDNAIANLKTMMPPPGYGEGQIIPTPGAGGGNAQLMNQQKAASSLDNANVARPPAPPPFVAGTAAPACGEKVTPVTNDSD